MGIEEIVRHFFCLNDGLLVHFIACQDKQKEEKIDNIITLYDPCCSFTAHAQ